MKELADNRMPAGAALLRAWRRRLLSRVRKRVKGEGNVIRWGDSLLSGVRFDIVGDGNSVEIADGCILNSLVFHIRGNGHTVKIERHCRFTNGGSLWFEDSRCYCGIGEGSSFESVDIALTEPGSRVEIGRDCMFAYDIDVRTGDSHSIVEVETGRRINPAMNVRIGDHVWVGAHAVLLKGVELPDNCIVASGAVVTKGFEEAGVILAGNPARAVRNGVSWLRERI
jgi:acetyltransferase-like isoleucine patch superfamily enzyme